MVPTARVSGEVRVGELPSKTGLTYYHKIKQYGLSGIQGHANKDLIICRTV